MYMKMPVMVANRKGVLKEKPIYTAIGVVVAIRLKEDEELAQPLNIITLNTTIPFASASFNTQDYSSFIVNILKSR
jgi:hypothetical protein